MEGVAYVCAHEGDQSTDGLVACMTHRDEALSSGWYQVEMVSVEDAMEILRAAGYQPVVDGQDALWPHGEKFN